MCSKEGSVSCFLLPIQHGVATESGTVMLMQHIKLLLELHPSWVILKSDIKNAFNSMNRSHMLNQVSTSFPDIFSHAFQVYSGLIPLIYQNGEETVVLKSQQDVHQGDPLGPALFSIRMQPILVPSEQSILISVC